MIGLSAGLGAVGAMRNSDNPYRTALELLIIILLIGNCCVFKEYFPDFVVNFLKDFMEYNSRLYTKPILMGLHAVIIILPFVIIDIGLYFLLSLLKTRYILLLFVINLTAFIWRIIYFMNHPAAY